MLEYNTEREKLPYKSYGRNIQKLVLSLLEIEDRAERTEAARAVVYIMSQLAPLSKENASQSNNKDVKQYWHKIWDHLFMISNYQLDIDAPFPKPIPEETKNEVITEHNYKKSKLHYRTYGRNFENYIKKVSDFPEEIRSKISIHLANQLKKLYITYNSNSVNDQLIIDQLKELSNGKISLPADTILKSTREIKTSHFAAINKNNLKKKKKLNNPKNKGNQ